jgi:UDP:flavonoid glycosyltransferase YjiC (YdhE family)
LGIGGSNSFDDLEDEMATAAGESRLVVRGRAPQFAILGHTAVGTFMTHCSWGSIMEAASVGRLMLTWPLHGEQFFNEKFVVDVAGIGASMDVERGHTSGEEGEEKGLY